MSAGVSAIVPTWNGAQFVRATLDSVLAQRRPPLEVLVVDDGSTDGTPEILAGYGARVRVLRQENRGVAAARNLAAGQARGEILAFLDHDDLWEPGFLATLAPVLEARPEVGLAYADSWVIDADGAVRGRRSEHLRCAEGDVFAPLLAGNFIPVETTLVRAALFRAVEGFDASLRYVEDWDLCLRLARRTRVAYLPEPLARYRVHARNLSHERDELVAEAAAMLQRLSEREPGLSAREAALLGRERARLLAALAWRALRRRDPAAARAWMERGGARAPLAARARVHALRAALGLLPRAAGDLLLRRLPRARLYGVEAPDAAEPGRRR